MNKILLISVAALALLGTTVFLTMRSGSASVGTSAIPQKVVDSFKTWSEKYGKKYGSPEEQADRLTVFYGNYQKIENHPKEATYTVSQNQFMDLTTEEFAAYYLGYVGTSSGSNDVHELSGNEAPASVDWRTQGAVTPIKDQGQCGSCWSFSTTGSLEGVSKVTGGSLGNFSEQQLVDCSGSYGNNGCNGGLMDNAFKYVIAKGITDESKYPYKAVQGTCQTDGGAFKITSYKDVKRPGLFAKGCPDLLDAVAQQPVSVAVDAEQWQFYSGGVFNNCGKSLDHGVLAVGYDTDSNWIVKNSWGTSWGENGFIRLASGNTCGICNSASYPIM